MISRDLLRRFAVVLSVAAVVTTTDQLTKFQVVQNLTVLFPWAGAVTPAERFHLFYTEQGVEHLARPAVTVIPGLFDLHYIENPGAAFNVLERANPGFRLAFFGLVTLLAVAFIGVMASRFTLAQWPALLALGGVLGGALGNFIDRITRGYVIDFVDWHLGANPRLHFPTFNVADMGISVGALVLLFQVTREALRRDA